MDYLYDLASHEIAEVASSGSWNRAEIYSGGRHVATYSGGVSGTTYFTHPDWLGTERARTNTSGSLYEACTSLPFGDWLTCSGTDPSPMHFTGKERDPVSSLDYFGARFYASNAGRFVTPDPIQHPSQSSWGMETLLNAPQRLNQYAYVLNNPLSHTDPTGDEIPVWESCEYSRQGCSAADRESQRSSAKFIIGASLTLGTAGVAGETGLFARAAVYGRGLITAAIAYLLTPRGQQNVVNLTQAIGDYVTGSVSPVSAAEVGAAREAAVAASVGGKIVNMKVFGASTSTEVDVLGKAGEYIGVGGPAKGRSLADFGQKLSALKDAAKQVGTTAKYYLELGTSQAAIDLAKKSWVTITW